MGEAKEGDIVEIKTSDETVKGTVIPSHDSKVVLLKLESGYNIGLEKSKIKSVKKVGKVKPSSFPEAKAVQSRNKPGVSFIVTGGTISSRVDYSTGAVKPLMNPNQLFFLVIRTFLY